MSRRGNIIYYITVAAVFIILEAAAAVMLGYNGQLQNTWLGKGLHGFMAGIWGGSESVRHYFSLGQENRRLAAENYHLRQELLRYGLEVRSGDTARDDTVGRYRYIPAEILKMSNNRQHNYLIIDKGAEDGIQPMSGIITGNGAVGIIEAVSRHYSYAISFNNPDMAVSARLGKDGAAGTLVWAGTGSRDAILNEIPHHIDVEEGDTVFTSGFSAIFPPDIPLGVTGEKDLVNGSFFRIRVKLFEDFRRLRFVTVVHSIDKEEIEALENK